MPAYTRGDVFLFFLLHVHALCVSVWKLACAYMRRMRCAVHLFKGLWWATVSIPCNSCHVG